MSSSSRLSTVVGSLFVGLLLAAAWPQVIASEPAPKAPSANESAVLKRILGNWRAREARVKTFYVAWDSRWVLPNNRGAGVAQGRTEFWMAGNTRYRLVNSPAPIPQPQQAGRAGGWRHTFDGVTHRTLDSAYRIGAVWNGRRGIEMNGVDVTPLLNAMRPLSRGRIDLSSQQVRVVSESARLENKRCVKLQQIDGDAVLNLWIDPARDDVLVGWEGLWKKSLQGSLFIDYQEDKDHAWVPARWTVTDDSIEGNPSTENTVTRFTVNEIFPRDTFTLTFPPGTIVLDKKRKQNYTVAEDGSRKLDTTGSLKIYETLDEATDFTIDKEPLKDALEFIAQRYRIKVTIDTRAQPLIDPSAEVQFATGGIKLRQVMELLLKQPPHPLAFDVRKGALVIIPVSPKQAAKAR